MTKTLVPVITPLIWHNLKIKLLTFANRKNSHHNQFTAFVDVVFLQNCKSQSAAATSGSTGFDRDDWRGSKTDSGEDEIDDEIRSEN